jgi:hypothetical protein
MYTNSMFFNYMWVTVYTDDNDVTGSLLPWYFKQF